MTLREEVAALRAEVAALRDVTALFYEAGRADVLGQRPRVVNPGGKSSPRRGEFLPARSTSRHLTVVQP